MSDEEKISEQKETKQIHDMVAASLVFAGAISHLLKSGEGVIVAVQGDMRQFFPNQKNVMVYCTENQVRISKAGDSLNPGERIAVHPAEEKIEDPKLG